jgi:hypothetical protein
MKKRDLSSDSKQVILVVISLVGTFIARRKPGVLGYQQDDTTTAARWNSCDV